MQDFGTAADHGKLKRAAQKQRGGGMEARREEQRADSETGGNAALQRGQQRADEVLGRAALPGRQTIRRQENASAIGVLSGSRELSVQNAAASPGKPSPMRQHQEAEGEEAALGIEILSLSRSELYVNMHFLDLALSALRFVPDSSILEEGNGRGIATDAERLYFAPETLFSLYKKSRILVNRALLHVLIHCIFCHFAGQKTREKRLYDLACDIAAEHLIDGMQSAALHVPRDPVKGAWYKRLAGEGVKVMNAERIYAVLKALDLSAPAFLEAERAFAVDNHARWMDDSQKPQAMMARQEHWKEVREKMQTALETGQKDAGSGDGGLGEMLTAANRRRYAFREFLRKFSVLREELKTDDDSFDYMFYTYGLSHYGNMPLIEPLETKEVFAVAEFVVVLDTSYSTNGALVRRFLETCYEVLAEKNSYFKRVNIRIIQADEQIQEDQLIRSREELEQYMQHFYLKGGGGTDFRPAFAYVNALIAAGKFTHLKGLLYFTDGKGIYPLKRPNYDVAFVFLKEAYDDTDVPNWAMKLMLSASDLENPAGD